MPEFIPRFGNHTSGPMVYLQADQSKKLRALRGTNYPTKPAGVRVIVRDGEILQPKHNSKILPKDSRRIPKAESKLTAQYVIRAGMPAKTNPGATQRNRHGLDLDNC